MAPKKAVDTKVFIDEFKGNPVIAIFGVDEDGEKVSQYPEASFGKAKAKVILKHMTEIGNFVNGTDKKPGDDL